MKWYAFLIAVLFVVGLVFFQSTGANSQTVQIAQPCTVRTLSGTYGVISCGFVTSDPAVFFPTAGIGQFTYDGAF